MVQRKRKKITDQSDNELIKIIQDKNNKLSIIRDTKIELLDRMTQELDFSESLYTKMSVSVDKWDEKNLFDIVGSLTMLEQVVNESSLFLEKMNEDVDFHKIRRKKDLLIKSSSLAYHYLESIYVLLRIGNTVAATPILRSLIELEINTHYIYLSQGKQNLNKLVVRELNYAIQAVHNLAILHGSKGERSKQKDLETTERILKRRVKSYGDITAPSLHSRAKLVDQKVGDNMNEEAYYYFYVRFSDAIHGQTVLLDSLTKGISISYPGQLTDYRLIASLAVAHFAYIIEVAEAKVYTTSGFSKQLYDLLEEFNSS